MNMQNGSLDKNDFKNDLGMHPTVDGLLFLRNFYKMYIVDHSLYPYIIDVCL